MKLYAHVAFCAIVNFTSLLAYTYDNNLSLVTGYQHGYLKQNGFVEGFTSSARTDTRAKMSLAVIGFEGRLIFPQNLLPSDSRYDKLKNIFLTGHAIWGLSPGHQYKEHRVYHQPVSNPNSFLVPQAIRLTKGDLKEVYTQNYDIGVGYLFDLNYWNLMGFALTMQGGYSYHTQHLTTRNGFQSQVSLAPLKSATYHIGQQSYKDAHISNAWQGMWIGGDLYYEIYKWDINLGYRLHIGEYEGSNHLKNIPNELYEKTHFHSKEALGHSFNIKSSLKISDKLSAGVLTTYEYWRASHGSMRLKAVNEDYAFTNSLVTHGKLIESHWKAFTIAATIGLKF